MVPDNLGRARMARSLLDRHSHTGRIVIYATIVNMIIATLAVLGWTDHPRVILASVFGALSVTSLVCVFLLRSFNIKLMDILTEQAGMASRDPLTGLYNRRFFEEVFAICAERAERYWRPLSVILIDLDHFKNVNDTYGHDAGDKVLIGAAERIRASLRQSDVVARWGGEEFVAILPETDVRDASIVAENIRRNLECSPLALHVTVTASVGISVVQAGHHPDMDMMIGTADQAVYIAKDSGRNCVKCAAVL